jgi:hypothetical protein
MFQNLFCSLYKYLLLWLPRMYENCLDASFSTARFTYWHIRELTPGISYRMSTVLSVSATPLSPYRLTNYMCPTAQKKYFQESNLCVWITCNHQTTRRHTPEDSNLNIRRHEPLNLIPLPSGLGFLHFLCSNLGIYSLHQHIDACLFTQLQPQRSTDNLWCFFNLFLSLHRAFWKFTYYHTPTNALITSFII